MSEGVVRGSSSSLDENDLEVHDIGARRSRLEQSARLLEEP
jgi:hypothetical protein